VNNTKEGFEAWIFHPDHGNEMVPGAIFVDPRTLRFRADDISFDIPLDDLRLEVDGKNDGRICFIGRERPDVKCFTLDESILEHWAFARSNHVRRQLQKIAGHADTWRRVRITLCAFVIFGVCAWLGQYALALMVRASVQTVPAEWEKSFGDKEMLKLSRELRVVDDSNRVAQLTALAEPLTRVLPGKTELKFHLYESYFPQAFALPGGHVVVSTGLLGVTDRPEQLLGVLAHELAHVSKRHSLQQAISGAGPVLLLHILLSDRNNRINALGKLSGVLIYESFSRNFEREADATGWDYLVKANVDPRGMIEMLKKLKQDVGDAPKSLQAFNSHPALDDRIRWLEEKWEKLPEKSGFLVLTNPVPAGTIGNSSDRFNEAMETLSRRNKSRK
jgi:Zn-dependent protease with chaperone function